MNVTLYAITGDGNSSSLVGQLAGPNSGFFPTGNLAFGPGGNLYFNYSSDVANGGANSTLYTVNTSTGALTAVGSGLGSDISPSSRMEIRSTGSMQTLRPISVFSELTLRPALRHRCPP